VTAPRGAGRGAWVGNEARQIQIRRRFQLLGMTVDGMRVWDIRRAIQIVRQECPQLQELRLRARSGAEEIVLLASLYEAAGGNRDCSDDQWWSGSAIFDPEPDSFNACRDAAGAGGIQIASCSLQRQELMQSSRRKPHPAKTGRVSRSSLVTEAF
jgi:hypothetical protein